MRGRVAFAARLALGCALLAVAGAPPATAQTPRKQQSYPVSAFVIENPLPHPDHPDADALLAIEVEMRITRGGLMQPHPTTNNVRFSLGRVPEGSRFWTSGLQYVNRQILAEFERRGIGGVILTLPDLEEGTGRDLRPAGETRLRIRIWTGRIENVATVADGSRFAGSVAERTNRPEHRFVREGSPVRPGGDASLIRVEEIEDYTKRLSRHPGRRVDAKLRPGDIPGTSRLDYHVAEHKPWLAYAQIANNGTESTTETRERFGFSHTQLTGHDDILRLDYLTGDFDEVHAGFGSYEFPLFRRDVVRLRVDGSWSQYDASEVGVSRLEFSGEQWEGGGRLIANLLQCGGLFVDAFGGAHWRNVSVENEFTLGPGEAESDFLLPEAGLAFWYDGLIAQLDFEAGVDWNLASVAGTETGLELAKLGRGQPSANFERLRWNGRFSFFLEPIVLYRRGWGDPGAPSRSTLAHEVVVSTRGQWSFGDRLIPQLQQVVGGLYTVRGYDQSIVAGDGAVIGSIEYRLHLARLLDPGVEPIELPVLGPFQVWPRTVFARPDWDLVLKGFVDGARTYETRTDEPSVLNNTEDRESLLAVGLGVEVQFMRYLRAGIDVAWPRSKLSDETTGSDDPEYHFTATLMF
jgi:hemolysin activation/secretion protein